MRSRHRGRSHVLRTAVFFVLVCVLMTIPDVHAYNKVFFLSAKQQALITLEEYNSTFVISFYLTFNHSLDVGNQLHVWAVNSSSSVQASYDLILGRYVISDQGSQLCTVRFLGTESFILSEEYAKLDIESSLLIQIKSVETIDAGSGGMADASSLPTPFIIVILLFSIVPFMFLANDVLVELREQLEVELTNKGVYGRLFAIFLPLFSIALTILMMYILTQHVALLKAEG